MGKKKYSVNSLFFDDKNAISSYIAGFITADGCVHKPKNRNTLQLSIGLNVQDIEILEYIKKQLQYTGSVKKSNCFDQTHQKVHHKATLTIYDTYLCKSLWENWHICPRKTGFEKLPDLNDECFYNYMRGLLDGDGTVYNKSGYTLVVRIFSASELFLQSIQARFGFGNIYLGRTCYEWRTETRDSLKLRDLIYTENCFSLERKRTRMFSVNKVFGEFTKEDDRIITESLSANPPLQFKQIGVLLDRNQEAVAKRAEKLGLYKRIKLRRFTPEEVSYIKSQIDINNKIECVERLSKELGISYSTMRWKVYDICAQ